MRVDIVSISGGKDSAALAIYLNKNSKYKDMKFEYIFVDTGEELEETYKYLEKLENLLGIKIKRLTPKKSFDEYLLEHNYFLPSIRDRWCTKKLKIDTFLDYIKIYKDKKIYNYVGIRADEEHRKGLVIDNVNTVMPFKENGLVLNDVKRILYENGLGLPEYYDNVYDEKFDISYNRSRSGCYFCFFMKKIEWVWLYEKHPKLFKKAMEYEKENFSWIDGMRLEDLIKNIDKIKLSYKNNKRTKKGKLLADIVDETLDENDDCSFCL